MPKLSKYLDSNYIAFLTHDELKSLGFCKWCKAHES